MNKHADLERADAAEVVETDSATGAEWLARYTASMLNVFGTPQRVLVRGAGPYVWDADGRQYLDLLGGIAVNALGHAHPFVTSVISSQLSTLGHVSNFFASPPQISLAEQLLQLTEAPEGSRVFFANSGTEANEAAFKLARRNNDGGKRTTVVALEGAFHGRTMGALALTAKKAYREPFEPLPSGVVHIPFGDEDALRAAVTDTTAALILEPVQGEAGVHPLSDDYLRLARELTTEHGALLIFDEVQTGVGRTGFWFNHQRAGIQPDAMTLAKGLGGGFPIGAIITYGNKVSALLNPGQHGTTFGGNPVGTAAALATLHVIDSQNVLGNVKAVGEYLAERLRCEDGVVEVRQHGLLIGIDLAGEVAAPFAAAALEAGFIINAPGPRTLRLAPPLNLTQDQAGSFVEAFTSIYNTAVAVSAAAEKDAS